MSETEQLIRQAIRELHIDIEPYNRGIAINTDDGAHKMALRNRKGDSVDVTIRDGLDYTEIYTALRTAWRG